MQLFNFLFNTNVADTLSKKAGKIMSVFTKTQNDLVELNTQIDIAIEEKQYEAKRIALHIESLTATKGQNTKVITKIDTFLND